MADRQIFSQWLESVMSETGLSQAQLARQANVSRAAINGILTGARGPGIELCLAISEALNIPPEEVFRHAGILPPISKQDSQYQKAQFLYSGLNDDNKARALEFLEYLKVQESKGGKNAKTTPRSPQPKLS